MAKVQDATLGKHDVEVQLLAQAFPELERVLVQMSSFIPKVIGANDGGIASGVATAYPAFFKHGNVGNTVLFGQLVGGREPMSTTADDDGLVASLRRWTAPGRLPVFMVAKGVSNQGEN